MKGSRCSCGKTIVIERDICPKCGLAMEPCELGNRATLLTYTTLHTVPEGFAGPIHLVLVELEPHVHLLCTSQAESDLKIGKTGTIVGEPGKYIFVNDED